MLGGSTAGDEVHQMYTVGGAKNGAWYVSCDGSMHPQTNQCSCLSMVKIVQSKQMCMQIVEKPVVKFRHTVTPESFDSLVVR